VKRALMSILMVTVLLGLLVSGISCTKTVYVTTTPSSPSKATGSGIPAGKYISDGYLGSRYIIIAGTTFTMYCQSKVTGILGDVSDFPQLGLHTYRYQLYQRQNPGGSKTLDAADRIQLIDVVNDNDYDQSFKYMKDYKIMVIGGDSYRIQ